MARKQTRPPAPQKPRTTPGQQFFKQWRKHRRLTLEKAAELADMTAGNISAMERNAQGYSRESLESLARAYGCTPGDLLDVDPSKGSGSIWPIWETATASDRQKIVDIAKTIVGKTDADN